MPGDSRFRVALIADAHFHDPFGDFGLGVDLGRGRMAVRPWTEVQTAARAVNEAAAALTAALDRILAAGVRHVVLAGDYTDDGQHETTRRLAALLARYAALGLRFYAIPGNHDLYGPHGKHTSTRLVTAAGQSVLVSSDPDMEGALLTPAMRCGGMPDALLAMAAHGLFRDARDLHWESPFGPSDAPHARMYLAHAADGSVSQPLMDASYLVEPDAGLWLLMIDANVFEPRPGRHDATRKKAFIDPTDAGWNAVLRVKPHLLPWIADVTARAGALGKTLIPVSHYPVLDPFQDAAGSEVALFGQTSFARRTPGPAVAKALIAAGVRFHAGGHLHVKAVTRQGGLTDVALPSLVSCPPGFGIVTALGTDVALETLSLADLPPDPDLTALYAAEGRTGPGRPYGAFLETQFRARLHRRMTRDWPADVLAATQGRTLADLVGMLGGQGGDATPLEQVIADACLLREAGDLAGLAPDRMARLRAIAVFGDAAADPRASVAAFLRRFLSVLQVSLSRVELTGAKAG
ncbi:MAG: metallophosphoesterase [Pseudomonadota bacterium]